MSDRAIEDLYIQVGDRHVELNDDVTEACLSVTGRDTEHIWLQADHIAVLRDWCDQWLALYGTLRAGGPSG